jgi:hypothetical protein
VARAALRGQLGDSQGIAEIHLPEPLPAAGLFDGRAQGAKHMTGLERIGPFVEAVEINDDGPQPGALDIVRPRAAAHCRDARELRPGGELLDACAAHQSGGADNNRGVRYRRGH